MRETGGGGREGMGFFARQFMLDSTSSASDARTHPELSRTYAHILRTHKKGGFDDGLPTQFEEGEACS